jgi:hypothetical protein
MPDGVLQDRLPEERGHRGIERLRRNVPHDLESILESDLLDFQIHPEKVDLLPQRDYLMARVVQRETQQPAQAGDHQVGRIRLGVNQLGHGVQGIEEEMRLQLHLEHLEVSTRQPSLQLGGVQLPGAIQVGRPAERDDGQIGQHPGGKAFEEQSGPELPRPHHSGCQPQHPFQHTGGEKEAEAGDAVYHRAAKAIAGGKRGVAGEPENRRG